MAMWKALDLDNNYLTVPAGDTQSAIAEAKRHGLKAFAAIPVDVNVATRQPNFRLTNQPTDRQDNV